MKKIKNRNIAETTDYRYEEQQNALRELCREYGLVYYLPEYHADKTDPNTVLIYTKKAHEHNESLQRYGYTYDGEIPYILCFQNTDRNGLFNLDFMNRGKIDFRSAKNAKSILKPVFEKAMKIELDRFPCYCVVIVDNKAISVRRYDTEKSYLKDVGDMTSVFMGKSEAIHEARRVAKMSKWEFIPYAEKSSEGGNIKC